MTLTRDRPHDGWLDMSKPFIAAFKDGASSPNGYITSDELIYWYRPAPRDVNCDSTDTCMVPANNGSGNYFIGRPNGWATMRDSIFVVSLLQAPALIRVNTGGIVFDYNAPAGAFAQSLPMNVGNQSFAIIRDGKTVLSGASLKPIINGCVCGLYNFNAYGRTTCRPFLSVWISDQVICSWKSSSWLQRSAPAGWTGRILAGSARPNLSTNSIAGDRIPSFKHNVDSFLNSNNHDLSGLHHHNHSFVDCEHHCHSRRDRYCNADGDNHLQCIRWGNQ